MSFNGGRMMNSIIRTWAVVAKDVRSELRTRYALNALLMFIVTSVATILFALHDDMLSPEILSGMFWVVIFFSAMSGLSRIFVSEEERGTTMTLRLVASPSVVYCGKLIFNSCLTLLLSSAVMVLYVVVFPHSLFNHRPSFSWRYFWGVLDSPLQRL